MILDNTTTEINLDSIENESSSRSRMEMVEVG